MSTLTLDGKEWAVYMTGDKLHPFMVVCADCACRPDYDAQMQAYEWQDRAARYTAGHELLERLAVKTDAGDYAPPPYSLDLFHGFHRIELPLRAMRYIFHTYPDDAPGGG